MCIDDVIENMGKGNGQTSITGNNNNTGGRRRTCKTCGKVHEDEILTVEEELEEDLDEALWEDDKEKFLSVTHRDTSYFCRRGQELLMIACDNASVDCAAALVNGETPLIVDLNLPTPEGLFPLHHAAETCWPSITELILCHGAQTDVRCEYDHRFQPNEKLSLHLTLNKLCAYVRMEGWTPKHSIFKLLTLLCVPRMQHKLETIGLLAWTTKETEREFLRYARDGKLVELAALLTVAHSKLIDPMLSVCNSFSSESSHALFNEDKKEKLSSLLEVFERAGDAIEAYVKQEKNDVTMEQTSKEVAAFFQKAGLPLKHADTDLIDWFHAEERARKGGSLHASTWTPKDIGMPHYGKSGYRWMAYSKQSEACRVLGRKPMASVPNEPEEIKRPWKPIKHRIPTIYDGGVPSAILVLHSQTGVEAKPKDNVSGVPGAISRFHSQTGVEAEAKDKVSRGVPSAISVLHSQTGVEAKAKDKVSGGPWVNALWNVSSRKPWASLASVMRGVVKRI